MTVERDFEMDIEKEQTDLLQLALNLAECSQAH